MSPPPLQRLRQLTLGFLQVTTLVQGMVTLPLVQHPTLLGVAVAMGTLPHITQGLPHIAQSTFKISREEKG